MVQHSESKQEPTIAPGMEMDELEAGASPEEIARGDSTMVTRLVRDRISDRNEEP